MPIQTLPAQFEARIAGFFVFLRVERILLRIMPGQVRYRLSSPIVDSLPQMPISPGNRYQSRSLLCDVHFPSASRYIERKAVADAIAGNGANMKLLTLNEVAETLSVHRSTVAEMCRKGLLKHRRVGVGRGVYRFKPSDVDQYLSEQSVRPSAPMPMASLGD